MSQQATPGVQKRAKSDPVMADFFSQMGKPIGFKVRQNAYENCLQMGLNKEMAMRAVNAVAEQLERDEPFTAQAQGMKFLDCTGIYRLMAALLTPEH